MSPFRRPIVEKPLPAEYFWPEFPSHLHAEKTILGAVLLDNAAHSEAAEKLDSEDFTLDSHRLIFLRMSELMKDQKAVDLLTLSNELARRRDGGEREIATIGGVAYLASLTEGLPRRPVISQYIRIVKEKAKLRRIIGVCEQAIAKANDQNETAAHIVKWMGESLKGMKELPCR